MAFGFAYNAVGTKCSSGVQLGTLILAKWAKARWSLPLVGTFNCRNSRLGFTLSTHAEGRAADLHVHTRASEARPTPDEKVIGDEMANFFVLYAFQLGVQRVIWLDQVWDVRTRKWAKYTGPFHGNHVHVELCWAAAKFLTIDQLNALVQFPQEDDDMPPLTTHFVRHQGHPVVYVAGYGVTPRAIVTFKSARDVATRQGVIIADTPTEPGYGEMVEDVAREQVLVWTVDDVGALLFDLPTAPG